MQPGYFHSLDFARGLAALAVVLWHWQHFFFNGAVPGTFDRQEQPFYSVLFLFYEKGWFAVDFFFVLSGFVFFWLYARPIQQRRVGPRDFFFLRLSRLYPLHLATLLLVAGLQWLNIRNHGTYFVYPLNDAYHFVLNLFFASAWGFQKGFSFNAPIWSVSVEVLLYAVFFCTVRLLTIRATHALLLAMAGLFLHGYSELIGRGLFAFYMGALVHFAYQKLLAEGLVHRCAKPLLLACLSAWLLTLLEFQLGSLQAVLGKFCTASCVGAGLERLKALWVTGILLPSTILALAVSETLGEGGWKRTAWLGEISYASYLLHFPLQLIFFAAFAETQPGRGIFYSPVLWLGYFALLIAFSLLAHRCFERPLQGWVRQSSLQKANSIVVPTSPP
ncbi:MAG: acyltransferase family protein [Gammaproteobacteria bacterium]